MERNCFSAAAGGRGSTQVYLPVATVKCDGPRLFRSQSARDLACILDVDPNVVTWTCMPVSIECGCRQHIPDFDVVDGGGQHWYFDAPDRAVDAVVEELAASAASHGRHYRLMMPDELYSGPRLRNAKDLLRYGNHVTSLGDRIRMLSVLEEEGSLTLAEALQIFQESKPAIAGLASMILKEQVEIDLDEAVLGPATLVRRIRR